MGAHYLANIIPPDVFGSYKEPWNSFKDFGHHDLNIEIPDKVEYSLEQISKALELQSLDVENLPNILRTCKKYSFFFPISLIMIIVCVISMTLEQRSDLLESALSLISKCYTSLWNDHHETLRSLIDCFYHFLSQANITGEQFVEYLGTFLPCNIS